MDDPTCDSELIRQYEKQQVFQETIDKSLAVLQQEMQEMHKKINTIKDDMTVLKQHMLEMNNHMTVLLNPHIYNRSREYDPSREMITGIIEYRE